MGSKSWVAPLQARSLQVTGQKRGFTIGPFERPIYRTREDWGQGQFPPLQHQGGAAREQVGLSHWMRWRRRAELGVLAVFNSVRQLAGWRTPPGQMLHKPPKFISTCLNIWRPAFILSSRCRISSCNAPLMLHRNQKLCHNPMPMWLIIRTTSVQRPCRFPFSDKSSALSQQRFTNKNPVLGVISPFNSTVLETPPKYL